jgi:CRISPR/Cas system CSM-associated protein Csm2 small subunit
MSVILVTKEDLEELLQNELEAWENIGGGPNLNAFEFNPEEVDPAQLRDLGYYTNRDSWIAGVRYKKVLEYLNKLEQFPPSARH